MKRSWGDEYLETHAKRHVDIEEEIDDASEDRWEEEGPLSGFEDAADAAYDKEFLAEDKNGTDWFEDVE